MRFISFLKSIFNLIFGRKKIIDKPVYNSVGVSNDDTIKTKPTPDELILVDDSSRGKEVIKNVDGSPTKLKQVVDNSEVKSELKKDEKPKYRKHRNKPSIKKSEE